MSQTRTPQPLEGWVLRLITFVLVGLLIAWLFRGQFEPMRSAVQDHLTSGRLLRRLRRGELEVYYQPILDLDQGRIVSIEALARWNHPRRGLISPDDFIPQVERTGAIAALDRHVLCEATRQVQWWSSEIAPIGVSVNVSASCFARDDLNATVAKVLERTGLELAAPPPRRHEAPVGAPRSRPAKLGEWTTCDKTGRFTRSRPGADLPLPGGLSAAAVRTEVTGSRGLYAAFRTAPSSKAVPDLPSCARGNNASWMAIPVFPRHGTS